MLGRSTVEAIFSVKQLMEKELREEENSSYGPHRSRESLQQDT